MALLNWTTDENLTNAVRFLFEKANEAQTNAETKFGKNVIDPFSALFQIGGFGLDYDTWLINEKTRQAQKTLQNHIGDFHQVILGNVQGWENKKVGGIVDIVSNEKKIVAEIKNKHNTVTGGALSVQYWQLEEQVMPKSSIYKGYTAYFVTIIPKKPQRFNLPFVPSDKNTGEKCPVNEKIRMIDGASFYSLVTGDENALKDLFEVLPQVITSCTGITLPEEGKQSLSAFFNQAFGGL